MNDAKRLAALFGSQKRMARVLDITPSHANRMIRGTKAVPRYVSLILGLLQEVPPIRWPDEIKQAMKDEDVHEGVSFLTLDTAGVEPTKRTRKTAAKKARTP